MPALAKLIDDLASDDATIRCNGARDLAQMGDSASGAVSPLIQLLNDDDFEVREAAVDALGKIGPRALLALSPLIRHLGDSASGCVEVKDAIVRLAPSPSVFISAVIAEFKEQSSDKQRDLAAEILRRLDPDLGRAVTILLSHAKDRTCEGRWLAVEMLGNLRCSTAIPTLVANLRDEDWEIRYCAALALGHMGAKASEAAPALLKGTSDADEWVRHASACALCQIDPTLGQANHEALAALRNPGPATGRSGPPRSGR